MTEENHRIRFMYQNLLQISSAVLNYSSQISPMVFTNCLNGFRSKYWAPSGNFTIDATNNKIYINDGTDKTATLTNGNYATPVLLAAQIQTKLNSVSTNWTVTYEYDVYLAKFNFKIARTTSATLKLSNQTNAIWDTIGFVTTADLVGTSFLANEIRIHTNEFVTVDFGYSAQIGFIALVGLIDERFTLSSDAVFRVRANNLNDFSSAPLDIECEVTKNGVYEFLPDDVSPYRYWRIDIIDRMNTNGPYEFVFSNLFMGDYLTFTNKNIANGLAEKIIDTSKVSQSENGTRFYEKGKKYSEFNSAAFTYIDKEQKEVLKDFFKEVGITDAFYVSFDPLKKISSTIDQYTRLVTWKEEPSFVQVVRDLHNTSLSFVEVV